MFPIVSGGSKTHEEIEWVRSAKICRKEKTFEYGDVQLSYWYQPQPWLIGKPNFMVGESQNDRPRTRCRSYCLLYIHKDERIIASNSRIKLSSSTSV